MQRKGIEIWYRILNHLEVLSPQTAPNVLGVFVPWESYSSKIGPEGFCTCKKHGDTGWGGAPPPTLKLVT
jgi:hypothetical protein